MHICSLYLVLSDQHVTELWLKICVLPCYGVKIKSVQQHSEKQEQITVVERDRKKLVIIIIIIIIIISFMQGIYIYIPETNYVAREYSVAAILLLLFMVLISLVPMLNLLYFHISTFCGICAVPN